MRPDDAASVDAAAFRHAMRHLPGGVSVVTAADRQGPAGVTVSALVSVAAIPPVLAVAVGRFNWVRSRAEATDAFAVSLLGTGQRAVAERFAAAATATFDGLDLVADPGQAPLLADAPAGLRCRLVDVVELYERAVLFGRVDAVRRGPEAAPLVYADGAYLGLGAPVP